MSDLLSQAEIDALLNGMGGGSDDFDSSDEEDSSIYSEDVAEEMEERGIVKSYDLAHQERIVRGRMPTFENIHERFIRLFRISMSTFLSRLVEIKATAVETCVWAARWTTVSTSYSAMARSTCAAAGNSGHASAAGDSGHASAAGHSGNASAAGNYGIAVALGKSYDKTTCAKARASVTGAIVLVDWSGKRPRIVTGYPGEDGIKADTWYRVEAGKLVECVE